jgi:hypothetical protein
MLEKVSLMNILKIACVLVTMVYATQLFAPTGDEEKEKHIALKIGNLALPVSQQIVPLFSYGQMILDKGVTQVYLDTYTFKFKQAHFASTLPYLVYGIRDDLSIIFFVPIAMSYALDGQRSSGFGDVAAQLEYAYFQKEKERYTLQATVLGIMNVPSGSAHTMPPTGAGVTTFLLGATFSFVSVDWYLFNDYCISIAANNHKITNPGNEFFYQAGIGHNIAYIPEKMIFSWLVELLGSYTKNHQFLNRININSGSHVVYLAPSLWYSTKHLVLQAGVALPVFQRYFDRQHSNKFIFATSIGWTFY